MDLSQLSSPLVVPGGDQGHCRHSEVIRAIALDGSLHLPYGLHDRLVAARLLSPTLNRSLFLFAQHTLILFEESSRQVAAWTARLLDALCSHLLSYLLRISSVPLRSARLRFVPLLRRRPHPYLLLPFRFSLLRGRRGSCFEPNRANSGKSAGTVCVWAAGGRCVWNGVCLGQGVVARRTPSPVACTTSSPVYEKESGTDVMIGYDE